MRIGDVMTRGVELVTPEASLEAVAVKMRDRGVGLIPVCENDRLIGVITDRDVTVRATAQGRAPQHTRVREGMTPQVLDCYEDQSLAEAANLMEQKAIRRLIVLNRQKRLVGIISIDDLAAVPGEEALVGEVLEHVAEPRPPAS